jgi:hypothetical protein
MKNLNLNFQQRLGVSNFLAQSQGALGKMTALQRIFLKVSFSDAEMQQIRQTPMGGGMVRYDPPAPDFGACDVSVDDADAEYLQAEIESGQTLHVSDIAWITAVKDQLANGGKRKK